MKRTFVTSLIVASCVLAPSLALAQAPAKAPAAETGGPKKGATKNKGKGKGAKAEAPEEAPQPAAEAPPAEPAVKPLDETLSGMAKADYAAGKILFTDGDPAGALVKFRAAYEASKEPRLLWNIAACQKAQRKYAKALTLVRQYEKEADALLTAEEKAEAKQIAEMLEPLVSKLTVTVNEPGATIVVDEEEVGQSPLTEPLLLDLGERKITVRKPGFVPVTRAASLTGSGETTFDAKLVAEVHEGRLIVRGGARDNIFVDGKQVGVGSWEGRLRPGGHSLKVTADGMRPFQTEVVIQDGQTRTIEPGLEVERKDGGVPGWLWIAGGALVATGAGIGGYFLFKPDDPAPKNPVEGTMGIAFLR